MITVVSNTAPLEESLGRDLGLFKDMGLAEACEAFDSATESAIHEMEMNILLSEHMYLYENGHDVTYFTEAGEETTEGKGVKETIKNAIMKVIDTVASLLQRAKEKVLGVISSIQKAIATHGKNENALKATAEKVVKKDSIKLSKVINWDEVETKVSNALDELKTAAATAGAEIKEYDIYNAAISAKDKSVSLVKYIEFLFKSSKKSIDTKLSDNRKAAKQLLNNARKASQDEEVARMKKVLSQYSKIYKDYVKLFNVQVSNSITTVKHLMKLDNSKETYKKEKTKDETVEVKAKVEEPKKPRKFMTRKNKEEAPKEKKGFGKILNKNK